MLPNRPFNAVLALGRKQVSVIEKPAKNAEKSHVAEARFACANLRFRPNIPPESGRVMGPRSGYLREDF
jgi:hypothetical protein